MEVATTASSFALQTHTRAFPTRFPYRILKATRAQATTTKTTSSLSHKAPLRTNFIGPFAGTSLFTDFSGHKIRPSSLNPEVSSNSRPKRGVVTMGGEKLGYETFAVHDVMMYVKPPLFTLCVGKGRSSLTFGIWCKGKPLCSSHINNMIKQPIAGFQGQATRK